MSKAVIIGSDRGNQFGGIPGAIDAVYECAKKIE